MHERGQNCKSVSGSKNVGRNLNESEEEKKKKLLNERSFVKASKGKKKLKKMELIYILNVMIIINGKFNFTHTQTHRRGSLIKLVGF